MVVIGGGDPDRITPYRPSAEALSIGAQNYGGSPRDDYGSRAQRGTAHGSSTPGIPGRLALPQEMYSRASLGRPTDLEFNGPSIGPRYDNKPLIPPRVVAARYSCRGH